MNDDIKKFAEDIWKKEFDKFIVNDIVDRYIKNLQQELDQYKNNWEELKKYCKEEIEEGNKRPDDYVKYGLVDYVKGCVGTYERILNKMKELEEDK